MGLGRSLRLAGGRRQESLRLPRRDEEAQQLHRQRVQAARKRRLRESTFTGLHVRAWMTVWQGRHPVHSRRTGIRKSRSPTRPVKPYCAVKLSTQHADAVVPCAPAEGCFSRGPELEPRQETALELVMIHVLTPTPSQTMAINLALTLHSADSRVPDLEQAEGEALGGGGALQAVDDEQAAGGAGQGAALRQALEQRLRPAECHGKQHILIRLS